MPYGIVGLNLGLGLGLNLGTANLTRGAASLAIFDNMLASLPQGGVAGNGSSRGASGFGNQSPGLLPPGPSGSGVGRGPSSQGALPPGPLGLGGRGPSQGGRSGPGNSRGGSRSGKPGRVDVGSTGGVCGGSGKSCIGPASLFIVRKITVILCNCQVNTVVYYYTIQIYIYVNNNRCRVIRPS